MTESDIDPIRITVRTVSPKNRSITLSNLTSDEQTAIEGFTQGTQWIKINDGRLVLQPVYKELPELVNDPLISSHWSNISRQLTFEFWEEQVDSQPNIIIQHLCGYNHHTTYEEEAARLLSYGFVCCRSKRHADGRFHELWLLWLFKASGNLKEMIDEHDAQNKQIETAFIGAVPLHDRTQATKSRVDAIVKFLCKTVSFGTLDVSSQRAAMVMDD